MNFKEPMIAKVKQSITEAYLEGITPEVESTDDLTQSQKDILYEALNKIDGKSDKQLQRAFQSRLSILYTFWLHRISQSAKIVRWTHFLPISYLVHNALTLRRPLRKTLRMRWFFDVSKVKEASFFQIGPH